jgi:hypothetical protein
MAGRPAIVRQRDVKQIIGAAKSAGAKDVTVLIGEVSLIINLADEKPIAPEEQIRGPVCMAPRSM